MSTNNIFNYSDRPNTPPELLKFRRSAHEVGRRYIHPRVAEDVQFLGLEEKTFGRNLKSKDNTSAKDVIASHPQGVVEKLNSMKGEMHSKQHRLGKSQNLGTLPPDYDTGAVRGVSTKGSEAAKEVIFPHPTEDPLKGAEHYRISHASFQPGEQKRRNYDWSVDPNQVRFGKKSELAAFNGVSRGVTEALSSGQGDGVIGSKALEDYRELGDTLGRRRSRLQDPKLPPTYTFGKSTGKDEMSAAKIMQGTYSEREQLPDTDLGKSITPGFRNISVNDRVFGCPTIRSDLNRASRSIADSQAYGDDPGAQELITPAPFSDLAVPSDAFISGKPKEYLAKLFDNIGYTVPDNVCDVIFEVASDGEDSATISNFRAVMNEYLIADENGKGRDWLRAKTGRRF